ncbi:MAG: hypothetical protein M1834_001875 [Cirrosporium novae-zelandiae]|nr:MAG: hypothetical protein M1834_001875 [Cirrosporium novae-zelandiae]
MSGSQLEVLLKMLVAKVYSGIFHFLPLGLRVQDKLEKLIDKHMRTLGASKVSLSSISSQKLWEKSGRLDPEDSDAFLFKDRKGAKYLLSPTHEEEITTLVGGITKSYKELPIRLYQISRKYRDEPRPRQGLLRGREFLMKDLYTFDQSVPDALATYKSVRKAYTAFFNDLKIPYLVAKADSGSMGGDLSHEYHFPSSKGEDNIMSCSDCDYVANEELAQSKIVLEEWENTVIRNQDAIASWSGVTRDKKTLIVAFYPRFREPDFNNSPNIAAEAQRPEHQVNIHAIKPLVDSLAGGIETPVEEWSTLLQKSASKDASTLQNFRIISLIDYRLLPTLSKMGDQLIEFLIRQRLSNIPTNSLEQINHTIQTKSSPSTSTSTQPLDLLCIHDNSPCPSCSTGHLTVQKAVELGHTFYLGTRYSSKLNATIAMRDSTDQIPMQMGCHGIGVSRMIAAVADALVDNKGLNWPRVIAPYEAIIIPVKGCEGDAETVYDTLINANANVKASDDNGMNVPSLNRIDAILDDRPNKEFGWKLKDADLVGYPVIVVLGRSWKQSKKCEVQCRRLDNIRIEVPLEELREFVSRLLAKL